MFVLNYFSSLIVSLFESFSLTFIEIDVSLSFKVDVLRLNTDPLLWVSAGFMSGSCSMPSNPASSCFIRISSNFIFSIRIFSFSILSFSSCINFNLNISTAWIFLFTKSWRFLSRSIETCSKFMTFNFFLTIHLCMVYYDIM